MRFLVLGCNGMAGHMVGLYLRSQGHAVMGFARKRSSVMESIIGDVRDTAALRQNLEHASYDAVVNCVGILNADAEAHKVDACFINATLPHLLAEFTTGMATQVVHLSTDCVFSGRRGGYREDDVRDGPTFYDRSKALGELEDGKNLTLRTSIVGPDMHPSGIGLLNWFMRQQGEVKGFTRAIWTGQTTLQLAKTIEYAVRRRIPGLFNIVPDASISKYELLGLFNRYLRLEAVTVVPVEGLAVDKSLLRTRRELDCEVPTYERMVVELAEWMKTHAHLYPHYGGTPDARPAT
ncbi:MAG: sugar nucleotide-binding protein [Gemmatimonadaceae bacterium]